MNFNSEDAMDQKLIFTFNQDYQLINSQLVCDSDAEEAGLAKIENKIINCLQNGCGCFSEKKENL